jgi:hypothetical protein
MRWSAAVAAEVRPSLGEMACADDSNPEELPIPHPPTRHPGSVRTIVRRACSLGVASLALQLAPGASARAQTDYYNTDRGRPVQIEDAYSTERHAFELKLAPVRVEWADGAPSWGIEPEIAYGLLPRTHLEIGVPITFERADGGSRRAGMAGLELSIMHNLNAETRTIPALGLRADVLAPVGDRAPDRAYTTLTGMLTRTFSALRVHLNGQYTIGAEPTLITSRPVLGPAPVQDRASNVEELGRWLAGVAIDRTFPLRSLLLTAELFARQPIVEADDVALVAGAGMRWQASPSIALDLGFGRRVDASAGPWYATFGSAYAFGLSSLMPGGAR